MAQPAKKVTLQENMREIRVQLKKARKRQIVGADTILIRGNQYRASYWLITLYSGNHACAATSYLKKTKPCAKRRKRYLNIYHYIKCLNHEIMHAVLHDVVGTVAYVQWDNIVKTNDGAYQGKKYGWKNIIGAYLPGVYCADD